MKRLILLLIFYLSIIHLNLSQTQLTQFDYQVPVSKYFNLGIINVGPNEYLIETGFESIRVSSIVNDSIQKLYELSDFPDNDPPRYQYGRLHTRSGFAVDGNYLYEIFKKQIRKRNILTGLIEEIYQFPNEEIKWMTDMSIVDEIIHFTLNGDESYAIYNTSTQEFNFLSFSNTCTFRDKNTYYTKMGLNGITAFNAQNGTSVLLFENEKNFHCGANSNLNGQKGLVFGGFNQTRFINNDTTYLLNCNFGDPLSLELNIQESEQHYIVISDLFGDVTFKVKDKSNCDEILSGIYPSDGEDDSNIKIFNSPEFDDDYFLFALNYGDAFSSTQIMLYDKKELTLSLINEGGILSIKENSFYRIGDKIYFLGYPPIFDVNSANLYSLNLTTKTLKYNQPDFGNFEPISFAPSEKDSTFLISKVSQGTLIVSQFYDFEDAKFIYASIDYENGGLYQIQHLAIENEKLVFKFQDKIYLADNYSSSSNKVSLITEALKISKLIIADGKLEGLVNDNVTTFHFNYDLNTGELNKSPLDTYTNNITNSFTFSKYIMGTFSVFDKIYFDTEIDDFKPIPIDDDIITIHKSNQHILFLTSNDSGYSLTSFIDDEFVSFESNFIDKPQIISKNNGEFFISESINGTETQISVLKSDGTLGDKIVTSGKRLSLNQNGIESGPISAFMFSQNATDELEIIMHRYDKFHRYAIPFKGVSNYPIIWYKAGNSIIIKSDDDTEPGIYICTLGKEQKKLELNDVGFTNYKLLFATHKDGIISFMVDTYPFNLEIVQYNTETNTLTKTDAEAEELYYDWYGINKSIQIAPSQYYVTFPYEDLEGDSENSELFIFDSDNLTFELSSDLNQIFQYSNPHRFIESSSHLFFIARTYLDNSYQLYVKEKEAITSIPDDDAHESLFKIFPNPSSNFISLAIDAEVLIIQNSDGTLIKSINNYSSNQKIDISDLSNGVYFIEMSSKNIKSTSRFIKI